MAIYTLDADRAFPALTGGTGGGVTPGANSSTLEHVAYRPPHPRSLPAGEGGACMKRSTDLPPLRGGIKGGVNSVQPVRQARMRQSLFPTLIPSLPGREAARRKGGRP